MNLEEISLLTKFKFSVTMEELDKEKRVEVLPYAQAGTKISHSSKWPRYKCYYVHRTIGYDVPG